ncbi:SIMPL domain-containing protein [Porticoccaceae bacterium LTM1]|nr:SIMPL domain-containing protein [Porticoccaceae bacterium LTM1]
MCIQKLFFAGQLLLAALLPTTLLANPLSDKEHLVANGSGYVEAMPDYIQMELSITHTAATAAEAKKWVDEHTNNAIDAALNNGVKNEDMSATQLRIRPDYEYKDGERIYLGERVSRSVELKLRVLDKYGALIHALVESGISTFDSTLLDFDNRDTLQQQAQQKAILNARENAQRMAKGFGVKLGKIYQISEERFSTQGNYYHLAERNLLMDAPMKPHNSYSRLTISKQKVYGYISAVFYLEQ